MDTHAIVVGVGTELTSGLTVDTNSPYLSRRLAELGIVTLSHQIVDDHVDRISEALLQATERAEVVIVTGGLGPTADDLTRQALAKAMGVELVLDEAGLAEIAAFFRRRGRAMNRTNRVQAMLPAGAEALANAAGTAPGIFARLGKARVFVVPGVPAEMRRMTADHILPRLTDLAGGWRLAYRTLGVFGAGESDIASRLADLMGRQVNPLVGTTVAGGVISVRIIARAQTEAEARRRADETAQIVRERLGDYVFGSDGDTLAAAVGRLLGDRGATLCLAESCTGGRIGQLVTAVPGASETFLGGVVCYANRVKRDLLGVPEALLTAHGAVSKPVAEALATGARERFAATYALAVTGIAGPGGATEDKPVGLVYTALAGPAGVRVERSLFPGGREAVRMRTALTALNMLRLDLANVRES